MGLIVDFKMSRMRLTCDITSTVIGMLPHIAAPIMRYLYALYALSIIASAAQKATIMDTTEKRRKTRPESNFNGKLSRKSLSAKRDVRIQMNIITEVAEVKTDIESAMINTVNVMLFEKMGTPVFSSFPPGIVKAAANKIVVIRVPTIENDLADCFAHFSPSITSSLCVSVNSS